MQKAPWSRSHCEYLRTQANNKFDQIRSTWVECGRWALPHRIKWLLSQTPGERNNSHIIDPSHIIALRSFVAGFLEGNTSAGRPWYKIQGQDKEISKFPTHHEWLDTFTQRTLQALAASNFYNEAGQAYYDYGVFNTMCHFVDEIKDRLHFHTLIPGSYKIINNAYGEAIVLIREFSLTVKALVDEYGPGGDWANISRGVRELYENGNYTEMIDVVSITMENEHFDVNLPIGGTNRRWMTLTYEMGRNNANYNPGSGAFGSGELEDIDKEKYLRVAYSKRKPFIVGKAMSNGNYEYGEKGPTLDALGLIKSLNKKAISKDQALEQMLRPPLQGPANLKKSYITSAPNSYVPLDPTSLSQKGLRPIFEVNPAIASLLQDVTDLRQAIDKIYFADYLLYLSRNPRTRTATETNAIVQEQQLIIGPNLQALNWSYNVPIVEFVMDFVLDKDPHLPAPPEALQGQFLRTEFVSVFAQAQKAADLPSIDRYIEMVERVGQLNPKIWDKANLDKLADLYEDRLFLPAGLNNPQSQVDAQREQAQKMAQRQQMLQETLPAMAGAARDLNQVQQQNSPQGA